LRSSATGSRRSSSGRLVPTRRPSGSTICCGTRCGARSSPPAGDLVQALDAVSERLAEPLGDSSLLPTWLVCRAARRLMTVALGGDGADELFAGYPNFAVQRFAPAIRLVPPTFGRMLGLAVTALPSAAGYMNRRFLLRQPLPAAGDRRPQEARLCGADWRLDPHPLPRAVPRCPAVARKPGCRLVRPRRARSTARRAPRRPARPRQKALGSLHPVRGGGASADASFTNRCGCTHRRSIAGHSNDRACK